MKTVRSILLLVSAVWSALALAADARVKFSAAQAAYDLGDFEKARALYSEAYELDPRPALLFDIAQCHRKLGEWSQAAFFYRRYVARADAGVETERAERFIAEMDEKAALAAASSKPRLRPTAALLRPAAAPPPAPMLPPPPSAPPLVATQDEVPLYARWPVWAAAGVGSAMLTVAAVAIAASAQHGGPASSPPPPAPAPGHSAKH